MQIQSICFKIESFLLFIFIILNPDIVSYVWVHLSFANVFACPVVLAVRGDEPAFTCGQILEDQSVIDSNTI